MLLTDVPAVLVDYGTPNERPLGTVAMDDLDPGAFAAGSMGPKVEAACRFVRESGNPAVIGALDDLASVLRGEAGTRVIPGRPHAR